MKSGEKEDVGSIFGNFFMDGFCAVRNRLVGQNTLFEEPNWLTTPKQTCTIGKKPKAKASQYKKMAPETPTGSAPPFSKVPHPPFHVQSSRVLNKQFPPLKSLIPSKKPTKTWLSLSWASRSSMLYNIEEWSFHVMNSGCIKINQPIKTGLFLHASVNRSSMFPFIGGCFSIQLEFCCKTAHSFVWPAIIWY